MPQWQRVVDPTVCGAHAHHRLRPRRHTEICGPVRPALATVCPFTSRRGPIVMRNSFMVAHGLRRVWMCAAVAAHSHAEHATAGPTVATASHSAATSGSMQASAADQLRRQLNNARTQVDSLAERLTAVQHEALSWQTAWEKRKYKHEVTLRDLQQLRTQRKQLQEQVQQLEQQLATCQAGIASLVTTCEPFLSGRQGTSPQAALAQGSSPDQVLEAVETALKHHLQQQQQQAPSEGDAHDSSMALQEQQPMSTSCVQDEGQSLVSAASSASLGAPTGSAHSGACSNTSSSTSAAVSLSQAPAGGIVNGSQPAAAAPPAAASPEAPTQQPQAVTAAMHPAMSQLEARAQALQQANQGLQQQLDAAAATHASLRHTATRLSQQAMEAAAARETLQQQVAVLRASAQQVAWAGRAGAALLAVAGVAYLHWCEQQLSLARSNALVLQDRYQQLAQQLHGIDTTPAAALVGGASNA